MLCIRTKTPVDSPEQDHIRFNIPVFASKNNQIDGNRLAEEASTYCTLSRRTCCHALSLGFKIVCVSFASTIVKPFAAVCFLVEIESLYKSFTWTHFFRF